MCKVVCSVPLLRYCVNLKLVQLNLIHLKLHNEHSQQVLIAQQYTLVTIHFSFCSYTLLHLKSNEIAVLGFSCKLGSFSPAVPAYLAVTAFADEKFNIIRV